MSKMPVSKVVTALVVSGSLLAGQTVAASNASAREFRNGGYTQRHYAPAPRHYAPQHRGYRSHGRDRTGDAVAATILGLGALIVGSAIANAHKSKRYHDDD